MAYAQFADDTDRTYGTTAGTQLSLDDGIQSLMPSTTSYAPVTASTPVRRPPSITARDDRDSGTQLSLDTGIASLMPPAPIPVLAGPAPALRSPTFNPKPSLFAGTPENSRVLSAATDAIFGQESANEKNPYQAVGPKIKKGLYKGDNAYGKYQIMGGNIQSWAARSGFDLSSDRDGAIQEFLADESMQDAIFKDQFGSYLNEYGNVQDAASKWHSGRPLGEAIAAGATDGYKTTEDYVRDFTTRFDENMAREVEPQGYGMRGSEVPATIQSSGSKPLLGELVGEGDLLPSTTSALEQAGSMVIASDEELADLQARIDEPAWDPGLLGNISPLLGLGSKAFDWLGDKEKQTVYDKLSGVYENDGFFGTGLFSSDAVTYTPIRNSDGQVVGALGVDGDGKFVDYSGERMEDYSGPGEDLIKPREKAEPRKKDKSGGADPCPEGYVFNSSTQTCEILSDGADDTVSSLLPGPPDSQPVGPATPQTENIPIQSYNAVTLQPGEVPESYYGLGGIDLLNG